MSVEGAHLRSVIVSIEALEAERAAAFLKIAKLYRSAKRQGVGIKALRVLIRQRRIGREKIEAEAENVAGLARLAGDV